MPKINLDMRNIGKKPKRKPRKPLPTQTAELPQKLQAQGWEVSHGPKNQKNGYGGLGVMQCPNPKCRFPFSGGRCRTKTSEKAYDENPLHSGMIQDCEEDHFALLKELGFTPGSPGAGWTEDLIECGQCHRMASRLCWLFRHRHDKSTAIQASHIYMDLPTLQAQPRPIHKVTLESDDNGHCPSPDDQRLKDRAEGQNPPELQLENRVRAALQTSGVSAENITDELVQQEIARHFEQTSQQEKE